MITSATSEPADRRSVPEMLLRAPWSSSAWRDTAYVLLGAPIALVASSVVLALAAVALGLAVTVVFSIPFLVGLFAVSRVFTSWQRARVENFFGVTIPPPVTRFEGTTWLRRLWEEVRTAGTWRQIWYHALSGVTALLAYVIVLGFWAFGIVLSTIFINGWALPDRIIFARPLHRPGMFALLTVIGLILLFAAPWVAQVTARLDVALAKSLLQPSRSANLARRVVSLAESRNEVIDAADAERRRLERDLHDGTQQRLVSIAMNLGVTRMTLTEVPDSVRAAIEQAHEDAKLALSELRDMVRGLHPAVLDELGLDAALSGIAARSPVPVRLLVDVPVRAPQAVETVAYFVVSEALANVAKHAQANLIDIIVERGADNVLRVMISDDGRGGADPAGGTGLRGLQQRARSVDGSTTIDSPPGGPTVLVVELPCG